VNAGRELTFWNGSAPELLGNVNMSIAIQDHSETARTGVDSTNAPLPDIEIRFTPVIAWLMIGFGVIFFILGLCFVFLGHHRNPGLGLFISVTAVAAAIGGNYWRKHLHVVARMNPRQLVLRRDGPIEWDNIAAIENKVMHSFNHGVRHRSEFVCIKLKQKPTSKSGLEGFFLKAKSAITGYDIIVGASELSCTADWFVAECRKRMAAASALKA
jgi:hypothetical protein